MKRTSFFLIATALLFAGCVKLPKPNPNLKADFDYTVKDLTVTTDNKSSVGLKPSYWNWGDDSGNPGRESAQHTYSKPGSYDITLTCSDENTFAYTAKKTVTVGSDPGTDPSVDPGNYKELYLTGFKVYNLYGVTKEKYYVQFELQCMDLFGNPEPYVLMTPQMVLDYMLPLTMNLTEPVLIAELPDPFDRFREIMLSVYVSDTYTSQSGDIVFVKYLDDPSVIQLDGKTEYILTNAAGSKVSMLFEYRK